MRMGGLLGFEYIARDRSVRLNETNLWKGTLFVALSATGWGTWALLLRGHGLPPAWQSVMILCVVALAWLPSAARDTRKRPARTVAAWAILGASALTDAANYLTYFSALDRGPIALAVLTH